MAKVIRMLTIMAVIGLFITACVTTDTGTGGKTVVVTPAMKGNSASLNVGDKLEIRIPTIPKEGFEWVTQNLDTKILTQEGNAVYTADTSATSAGGVVTLIFTAVGKGTTNLGLLYVNASTSLSADSLGITVEVK